MEIKKIPSLETTHFTESPLSFEPPIYRFVVTGGPCGGKTTGLTYITKKLSEYGFRVFVVPEAATLAFTSGIQVSDIAKSDARVTFQSNLVLLQKHMENTIYDIARLTGEPSIIFSDRGLLDGAAYSTEEEWEAVEQRVNMPLRELVKSGDYYHTVFHMVSAAVAAEHAYTLDNNAARSEKQLDHAKESCDKVRQVYSQHPDTVLISNKDDFQHKLHDLLDEILERVVETIQITNTFLLENHIAPNLLAVLNQLGIRHHIMAVERIYYVDQTSREEGILEKVIKSSDKVTYRKIITKQETADHGMIQVTTLLTKEDYNIFRDLCALKNNNCKFSLLNRMNFAWDQQSYDIETSHLEENVVLSVHRPVDNKKLSPIPEFLQIKEEITPKLTFESLK